MIRFQMSEETAELLSALLSTAAEKHRENLKIAKDCAAQNPNYQHFVEQFEKQVRTAADLSTQFATAEELTSFESLTIAPREG